MIKEAKSNLARSELSSLRWAYRDDMEAVRQLVASCHRHRPQTPTPAAARFSKGQPANSEMVGHTRRALYVVKMEASATERRIVGSDHS